VADVTAAVCDTHALLYYAGGSARLGRRAAQHFAACDRRQALTYVPAAVIWEVALLARAGRVNLRRTVRVFFDDLFSNPAYQPHDLTPTQIFDADDLRLARDPFDALICACARDLELPLITRDAAIAESGVVRTMW
jgi:PIN domain nuclease of toxin-antitoxin system